MNIDTFFLTAKDFTLLEVMRNRHFSEKDPLAPILKEKIKHALVVFRDDIPVNVATLNSRVTFSVDGRDPDTRIISHDDRAGAVGMCLPITTARGLALLGLAEGQEYRLVNQDGIEERILLESVPYQPEAAAREKHAMTVNRSSPHTRPPLRIIMGAASGPPRLVSGGCDDPGPAAA
ncbi:nucleoside-diphosphate kinase [Aureimonas glaciei]|uniref:Nucleoside-diphosphate kinase n=1 Tax=Aureimonas glaciei TaxID=1776957 RepID=A0A916YBX7_9HYPH|nr:nucleoside-diphosphate kinase [Aureimonas glaciei]GGD38017.1 nucleoside-diphosphate kinase [Aureimonas glaciei]